MTSRADAAAIVLAAGRSQRFGKENKLLHLIDGEPMVRVSVGNLLRVGLGHVVVVTGHDADAVERALNGLDVKCERNATPWAGMGNSLAAGANAVPDDVEAVAIVLADMPALKPETIGGQIDQFKPESGNDIAVPVFEGRRGHPVVFGHRYLGALRALSGDQGARSVLSENPERVQTIEVEDAGVLKDVDTPGDLSADS
jgi:molybdenum cofactor cytidylyltransferase